MKLNIGILGAGKIAAKMADTVAAMRDSGVQVLAVASRGLPRAQAFAAAHGVPRAYGSYEAMLADQDIHLVYIATPHSHHAAHTELCLAAGRHVLCEKAFTVNEAQARRVTAMAREKGLLLAEAIWTRYMPSRRLISGIIESGGLGRVHSLQANLGYPIWEVERMRSPQLAGGTLLDLGVYPINFALMAFGDGAVDITGEARLLDTGVDAVENITMRWPDGRQACLHATMMGPADRSGFIYGEKGYLFVQNINNPEKLEIYDAGHRLVRSVPVPQQISGYEYEVLACKRAIEQGLCECPEMPHEASCRVMALADSLRRQWGVCFPQEIEA